MVVRRHTKRNTHSTLVGAHVVTLHMLSQKLIYVLPDRATRYVSLIRRLSRKFQFRLPREIKHSFCKHCYVAFAPGVNCRVRVRKGFVTYSCFDCKKYTKIAYNSKK